MNYKDSSWRMPRWTDKSIKQRLTQFTALLIVQYVYANSQWAVFDAYFFHDLFMFQRIPRCYDAALSQQLDEHNRAVAEWPLCPKRVNLHRSSAEPGEAIVRQSRCHISFHKVGRVNRRSNNLWKTGDKHDYGSWAVEEVRCLSCTSRFAAAGTYSTVYTLTLRLC